MLMKEMTHDSEATVSKSNLAQKRIPVTDKVWRDLSNLKAPGETYDQLLTDMIELKQKFDFITHLDELEKSGRFIGLNDAAKKFGIKIPKT